MKPGNKSGVFASSAVLTSSARIPPACRWDEWRRRYVIILINLVLCDTTVDASILVIVDPPKRWIIRQASIRVGVKPLPQQHRSFGNGFARWDADAHSMVNIKSNNSNSCGRRESAWVLLGDKRAKTRERESKSITGFGSRHTFGFVPNVASACETGNLRNSASTSFSLLLAGVSLAQSPNREQTQNHVSSPSATSHSAPNSTKIALVSQSANPPRKSTESASATLTPSIDAWIAVSGALISAIIGATLQSVCGPWVQQQLEQRRKHHEQEMARQEAAAREQAALAEREDGVHAYRHKLLAELRHLRILDMSSSLELEDIYVQLRVREEEPLRYAKEEEMAPLAIGSPTELLQRSQARLLEREEVALIPEDALVSFQRIVVLGDPGAGKTTMLRYLALKMAQAAEPQLPYLPIYVELGRFVESGMNNLLEFAATDWDRRYGVPNAYPYLEQQLHEGKAALLLDGLDEVLVGSTPDEAQQAYKLVADEINRLDTRFSKAPIAVTCRQAGWRGGLRGFETLEVLDLGWHEIQQFVNNWFKANPAKAEGLRQALALNLRMQTLAANPLILSLIAIVYEEQLELPERRAELYHRCGEVLLREWDAHRGIRRFSQFTADRKRDLLKEVAWHFHLDGRRYFPAAELLHLVANFLPTIDIPASESQAILAEIAAQYGLLKVQAHGWYGFLHLTFQEYLAALAANEKGAMGLGEVIARRADPWWEEVILLLAGRMHDATPLLLGILGHSFSQSLPEGELAVQDDLFHSDLLLAARCLVGTPIVRLRGLRDRILQEVKNLLETSFYKLDWQRSARVLVEVGGRTTIAKLIAMLADDNIERWKRWRIGSALEELGDRSVAVRLLELLEQEAELDPLVRGCIVSALAELKATFALRHLIYLLKTDSDCGLQEKIADVLGSLGDKSIVPELMVMLTDKQRDDCVRSTIALSIGRLGDKSAALKLLAMLLDPNVPPRMKPAIAQAVRDLEDQSLIGDLLKHLQDETLNWQIRWLLTEALESCQDAIPALQEILEQPHVDRRVRVGIAATLGTLRVQANISELLREAIEDQVVPPNWCLENHVEVGYVWQRLTRTLKTLGDDSVETVLFKAFEQHVSLGKWSCEVKGIIAAARTIKGSIASTPTSSSQYQPEAIAAAILTMLRQQETWYSFQDELVASLPELTTKSLVPDLLQILAERRMYNVSDEKWMGIVQAIAKTADDTKTVQIFLEMMPAKPKSEEEKHLAQVIYAALYAVSRRAGVRVSRDGHIESLIAASLASRGTS